MSSEAERQRLAAADEYCRHLLRHYENFTVASRLTPRPLRRDLTRVYAFCRTTDDLGDESGEPMLALRRLTEWRSEVEALFGGSVPLHPVLVALAPTVERRGLPAQPFLDLIDANGGTIPLAALSARTGEPPDTLRMALTLVQRLVNLDGASGAGEHDRRRETGRPGPCNADGTVLLHDGCILTRRV